MTSFFPSLVDSEAFAVFFAMLKFPLYNMSVPQDEPRRAVDQVSNSTQGDSLLDFRPKHSQTSWSPPAAKGKLTS